MKHRYQHQFKNGAVVSVVLETFGGRAVPEFVILVRRCKLVGVHSKEFCREFNLWADYVCDQMTHVDDMRAIDFAFSLAYARLCDLAEKPKK